MKKILSKIKMESNELISKTDDEIRTKIEKLKICGRKESLEKILPEWFAIVQEVSKRTIGLKHFETQLIAGFFLHKGKVVEMKTGEGKTLASTLPVSLNAILKEGVHVVTVNDYLAERDQKLMGKVYNGLGLSTGLIKGTSSFDEKRKNYNCDITYVTNSELVFDYLRDNSSEYLENVVQRPLSYCVIDEIDSILIDEARTPLILSTFQENINRDKLSIANAMVEMFVKDIDFELEEKTKEIHLTELGYEKALTKLGKTTLYDPRDPWALELLNALKAKHIFKLNKDYIILENKVCIVDEFTGRIMQDRRWSLGIHEAIETKENVEIEGGTKTKSSITYQNFFTLYPKLAGMTGTAKTAEKEFKEIYKLDVQVVPTQKPMIRNDLSDFVYATQMKKWKSVLNKAIDCFTRGQPLLIGTANVEKSELISQLLKEANIPHQLLNAKPENVKRESEIIALAGERKTVTIATNMAGRGTDIILGGNPVFQVKKKISELLRKQKNIDKKYLSFLEKIQEEYRNNLEELDRILKNLPDSLEDSSQTIQNFYHILEQEIFPIWEKENEFVKNIGGLFVLGTERHENRRIDNQLRGRAGRQGDPGASQFYLSLEDELIQVFGGTNIRNWMELLEDNDSPLESNFLTRSLEKAQEKVENYNYDIRKNIFEYDEILNNQRQIFFEIRRNILQNDIFPDFFLRSSEQLVMEKNEKERKNFNKNRNSFEEVFGSYSTFFAKIGKKKQKEKQKKYQTIWLSYDLRVAHGNYYQSNFLKKNKTQKILQMVDTFWTEHLERMSYFRDTVNWRSYGQQNPLLEYNLEAVNSFKFLLKEIRLYMLYYFLSSAFLNENL